MKRPDIIEFSLHLEEQYLSDSKSLPLSQLVEFNHTQHLSHFYAYIQEALQEHYSSLAQRDGSVAQWQREMDPCLGILTWIGCVPRVYLSCCMVSASAEVEVTQLPLASMQHVGMPLFCMCFQICSWYQVVSEELWKVRMLSADEISWAVKYALDAILAVPMSHFSQRISVDCFRRNLFRSTCRCYRNGVQRSEQKQRTFSDT